MLARKDLLDAPCWNVTRYFLNDNLWEISLHTGNSDFYLPLLFDSHQEALNYINSARFDIMDTRFCHCND